MRCARPLRASPHHPQPPAPAVKNKKLTNVRAVGHDEAIRLTPPRVFSLEDAIVYVAPDELVEVTPSAIRLRKRILDTSERERKARTFFKATRG